MQPGGAAAARPDPDAGGLGVAHQVGDDQEVGREAHLQDDADLVIDLLLLALGGARSGSARRPRLATSLRNQLSSVSPFRARELRQQLLVLERRRLDALGDQQRVVARLGQLSERRPHLRRRLQVELVGLELEAGRIGQGGAGLHAQQHLVRRAVGLLGVVQVVGGDQREVELLGDLDQLRERALLDVDAVLHQLDVEIAPAEDLGVLPGGALGELVIPALEGLAHLAAGATGGADDAAA